MVLWGKSIDTGTGIFQGSDVSAAGLRCGLTATQITGFQQFFQQYLKFDGF